MLMDRKATGLVDALDVGPFETESLGGWYENAFVLSADLFDPDPVPNKVQVRFTTSGLDDTGAVEAALDAFSVKKLGS